MGWDPSLVLHDKTIFWGTISRFLCRHPGVQNFVEIALSHTVSEINAFLHFTQKFKMAAKNKGENNF